MCGIVGVVSHLPVNQLIYDCLTVLQHRGQDAAGIVTQDGNRFYQQKAQGQVREVFNTKSMVNLVGTMGLGHVRYPTAGATTSLAEAQPLYVNSPYGIVLAHNGNLTNSDELAERLFKTDLRHVNTDSDSEVLLNVLAHELEQEQSEELTAYQLFQAVSRLYRHCQGGFAVCAMIAGHGLLAFRDHFGIRPLCLGCRTTDGQTEYMVASESVALTANGFSLIRDVEPGEAIYINQNGQLLSHQCVPAAALKPCLFEYVYLARPDSVMDNVSVYNARMKMGEALARKIQREWLEHDIDVVIPIPDTSRNSAIDLAHVLEVPYREGFVKNRYIGRTFIMSGQQTRKKSVRQKLSAIHSEFKGKNVLLVDDSIVRGTTCSQIIDMARAAGANKVYFASASPAVRYPNVYGIDMPVHSELIAHGKTEEQICVEIGADKLIYQDLEDLKALVLEDNPKIQGFDASVFDGKYIAGEIDQAYFERLLESRSDENIEKKNSSPQLLINLENS